MKGFSKAWCSFLSFLLPLFPLLSASLHVLFYFFPTVFSLLWLPFSHPSLGQPQDHRPFLRLCSSSFPLHAGPQMLCFHLDATLVHQSKNTPESSGHAKCKGEMMRRGLSCLRCQSCQIPCNYWMSMGFNVILKLFLNISVASRII